MDQSISFLAERGTVSKIQFLNSCTYIQTRHLSTLGSRIQLSAFSEKQFMFEDLVLSVLDIQRCCPYCKEIGPLCYIYLYVTSTQALDARLQSYVYW